MALTERFAAKRGYVVAGLGIGRILSWGSTFYLLAVLSGPISADTGWPAYLVVAGVSARRGSAPWWPATRGAPS